MRSTTRAVVTTREAAAKAARDVPRLTHELEVATRERRRLVDDAVSTGKSIPANKTVAKLAAERDLAAEREQATDRLHLRAWTEARWVLRPGGRLVVSIEDHVRGGVVQQVSAWNLGADIGLGFVLADTPDVGVPSLRGVANATTRVGFEYVFVLEAP